MTRARIPSSNILKSPKLLLSKNHPDLYWLDPNAVQIIDGDTTGYSQYNPSLSGYLVTSTQKVGANPLATTGNSVLATDGIISDNPMLGDVESIVGTIYKDSAGNNKVKYVIKIRNSAVGNSDVVGVDARIYNPYA